MRNLALPSTLLPLVAVFYMAQSWAATEQTLGVYNAKSFRSVRVACDRREIKSVRLVAGRPSSCSGHIAIRTAQIAYKEGFQQSFDFSGQGQGNSAVLTSTSLRVLPGTKCLSSISADISVINEKQKSCLDQHRVQVVVERE